MKLFDILTAHEILHSMEGKSPTEGMGLESTDDLKPLCDALITMVVRDALAKTVVVPSGKLHRIWLAVWRRFLSTRWGYRRAVRDVPVMMHAIQLVDLALREKSDGSLPCSRHGEKR